MVSEHRPLTRVGRITRSILCAAIALAVGACSKNPVSSAGNRPPAFGTADSVFTDGQVRAAAYSMYAGPQGFYSEQHPETYTAPIIVSTITTAACGARPDRWVELSTEDIAQARTWAAASVACNGDSDIVDTGPATVTDRYIEFVAYHPGEGPRHPVRVHRESYLDRSGFDRFHPDSLVGVLELRPVDDVAVTGVAEYLWYLDHPYAWPDTKPLTSFSRASNGSILHTIYFVHRTVGIGLLGPVPLIELYRDDFRVDTASGAIVFTETFLRDAR